MSFTTQLRIYSPDELDMTEYCHLQQFAFKELFEKNKIGIDYLDNAFFKWKYNPPAGKAKIAVATHNGKMIASVAMYPVFFVKKGGIFKGWHFVEAATLPEARGKKLFLKCMNLLIETLEAGEIIYVFPNKTSLHGTVRMGFRQIEQVPFYLTALLHRNKKRENSEFDFEFTSAQDLYAKELSENSVLLYRDADYMNWRYNQHPHVKYYSYSPKVGGKVVGNIVLRCSVIRGIRFLLLMEFHSLNIEAERQMVSYLKEVSAVENCFLTGLFSAGRSAAVFGSIAMLKVPSFLLPKKQVLMALGVETKTNSETNWVSQTGDWDAF